MRKLEKTYFTIPTIFLIYQVPFTETLIIYNTSTVVISVNVNVRVSKNLPKFDFR